MGSKKKKRFFGPYYLMIGKGKRALGISQHKTLRGARSKLTRLKKTRVGHGVKIARDYFLGTRRYTKVYPRTKGGG